MSAAFGGLGSMRSRRSAGATPPRAAASPGSPMEGGDATSSQRSARSAVSSKFLASSSSRLMSSASSGTAVSKDVDLASMLLHPDTVTVHDVDALGEDASPAALYVTARFGQPRASMAAVLKAKAPTDAVIAALFAACALSTVDFATLVKSDLNADVWKDLLESGSADVRRATLRALRIVLPRVLLALPPSGVFEHEADFDAALVEATDFAVQLYRKLCDMLTGEPDDGVVEEAFEGLDELFALPTVPDKIVKRVAQHLASSLALVVSRIAWIGPEAAPSACTAMLRVATQASLRHFTAHALVNAPAAPLYVLIDTALVPLASPALSGSVAVALTAAECLLDVKRLVPTAAAAMVASAANAALVCLGVLEGALHMVAAARSSLRLRCVQLLSRAARERETNPQQRLKLQARCAIECASSPDHLETRTQVLQAVALDLVQHGSDGLAGLLKGSLAFVWRKDESGRQLLAHALLTAALAVPQSDAHWLSNACDVLAALQEVLTWRADHGTLAGRAYILLLHAVAAKAPDAVVELDNNLIEWRLAHVTEGAVKYRLLFQLERSFAARRQPDDAVGAALVGAFAHSLRPGSPGFASMLSSLVHLAQTVPAQATAVQQLLTSLAKSRDLSRVEKDWLGDVRVCLVSPLRLHRPIGFIPVAFAPQSATRSPVHAQLSGSSDPLYVTGSAALVSETCMVVTLRACNVSKLLLVDVTLDVGVLGSLRLDTAPSRSFGNVSPAAALTWTFAVALERAPALSQRGLDVGVQMSGTRMVLPTWRLPYLGFFTEGAPGLFAFTPGWVEADQFRDAWARCATSMVCQVASQAKYSLRGYVVPGFARAKSASVRVGMFAATTWGGDALLVVALQSGSVLGVEVRASAAALEGLNIRALAEEMFPGGRVDCMGARWTDGDHAWSLPEACPVDFVPNEAAEKTGIARWQRMFKAKAAASSS